LNQAILIENKLNAGSPFTVRQKEGFGAIINGQTVMRVSYDRVEYRLTKDDSIPVSNQKIFRMYDHGTADLSQVNLEKIISVN
jgi:hypothetical protein